jgi:uncharacterized membrane-anchored protein
MTFDASPRLNPAAFNDLKDCVTVSVCDLTGVERFVVWAVRWAASLHDEPQFARECLEESFERAGLASVLPVFRTYVRSVHGEPSPCPPAARLGCWRLNATEAHTLHALACLQADRFGDAWRALAAVCRRVDAARAMLALGEVADALTAIDGKVRPWNDMSLMQQM